MNPDYIAGMDLASAHDIVSIAYYIRAAGGAWVRTSRDTYKAGVEAIDLADGKGINLKMAVAKVRADLAGKGEGK